MTVTSDKPRTLLEAVQHSLAHAARYNPGDMVAPAVLWTDADGQWRPVVASRRTLMAGDAVAGQVCSGEAKKHEHSVI